MSVHSQPWFLLDAVHNPARDQPVTREILGIVQAQDSYQTISRRDDFAAAWYYERDRYVAQYGGVRGALAAAPSYMQHDHLANFSPDLADLQSPNIVHSGTDTVTSWLFSEIPPLRIKAANLPLEAQASAEMYGRALDSILNTSENAETFRLLSRDGVLKGFAAAWPQYRDGAISLRRLVGAQCYVDGWDAADGDPRCVYVIEYRDKYALADWVENWTGLPNKDAKAKAVRELTPSPYWDANDRWTLYESDLVTKQVQNFVPRVRVVHAWRLASAPGRDDGRYVCLAGHNNSGPSGQPFTLIDQSFTRTTSPVCWWSPSKPDQGIRGQGLYHALAPFQRAIDRHMFRIQSTTDRFGWPKVLLDASAEDQAEAYALQAVAAMFRSGAAGQPPTVLPGIPLLREDIDWVQALMDMSLNLNGINALMAAGGSRLGAGASAVALQEENYRTTDRLSGTYEAFKAFRLRIGRQLLNVLDDALKAHPGYAAEFEWKGQQRSMKWTQLHRQSGKYNADVELGGTASEQRAGRAAAALDLGARGLLDGDQVQRVIQSTMDIAEANESATAGQRLVDWQLDVLVRLDEDKSLADLHDDAMTLADMDLDTLAFAVKRCTELQMRALSEGSSVETRTRLRDYRFAAEELIKERQPPPPPAMAPGVAPEVAPGMPL